MPVLVAVLLLALSASAASIKEEGTPLRAGCEVGAPPLTTLAAGTPVDVKFAMFGQGSPCYKIQVAGRTGYVSGTQLQDLAPPRKELATLDAKLASLPLTLLPKVPIRAELPKLPELKQMGRLSGTFITLYYDGEEVPESTATQLNAFLNNKLDDLSSGLGCREGSQLEAVAQSRASFLKSTGSAEWSDGQFDGRIRIPVASKDLDPATRRSLTHELTHACLVRMGRYPTWLHEGLAQKSAGDTVPEGMRVKLSGMARQGKLPKLATLDGDWSKLDTEHAASAYAQALSAVDLLYRNYGADGVRNLLADPEKVASVVPELDRRLGR